MSELTHLLYKDNKLKKISLPSNELVDNSKQVGFFP